VSKDWTLHVSTQENRPPQVELLSPKGGEEFSGDYLITWRAIDPESENLKIDLKASPDGGKTWVSLLDKGENTGEFLWSLQGFPDGNYTLKIVAEDPAGLKSEDISSVFTVRTSTLAPTLPPLLEILFPADGQRLEGIEEISWKASDPESREISVDIEYSLDSKNWAMIAEDEANDGSYLWDTTQVPNGRYFLRLVADNGVEKTIKLVEVLVDNELLGKVFISSDPPGCDIMINGQLYGKTNKEVELPVGTYKLSLVRGGYLDWSKDITISPGENPAINARLLPLIFGISPYYVILLVGISFLALLAIISRFKKK
jgi:hypothetical protein